MARYSHLPIYNRALTILNEFYQRVPKFNKQYKYFLGGKLIELSCKIIELIIRANSEEEIDTRIDVIRRLCLTINMLIVHIRIANEVRQLGGQKSYLYLSELAVDLSKQAEGWKKYIPQNVRAVSLDSEG